MTQRRAALLLLLAGFACLGVFLATLPLPRVDGHLVGSDGLRYFALLRSMIIDGDFHLANDYTLLDIPGHGTSPLGLPQCPFALGTPILWAPFFLIAHLVSLGLHALGTQVQTDGTGYGYEASACIGTVFYASLGFFLCFRSALRVAGTTPALLAVLALWGASPAIYYIIAEPSMSHGCSLFANALMLFLWLRQREAPNLWRTLWVGLAAGLVAMVRWQEAVLLAVPLVDWAVDASRGRLRWRGLVVRSSLFLAAALLAFSPQMIMWSAIYGSPLTIPQGGDFMHWLAPHPLLTLFSLRHGLITWHPLFLPALLGIPLLWRWHRPLALAALWVFLAQLYVNSAAHTWWGDDAFGGRRFVGIIPWMTPALALLLEPLLRKSRRGVYLAIALVILWNGLSLGQYRLGFISKNETPTLRQMTLDRMLLPVNMVRRDR